MIQSAELWGSPLKRIMDPVHGSIPIFSHEQKIIDDPLFQRLRHILQNDVVFYVFPGAKHNRLLHSIGTMHMASSLFIQITSSYLVLNQNNEISSEQRQAIKYLYTCIRLAALLHDTGHSPFAHQFENSDTIKEIMTPQLFKKIWEGVNYSAYYKNDIEHVMHEHFSVRIAYEILTRQGITDQIDISIDDILFFLETTEIEVSSALFNHCKNFMRIFVPNFEQLIRIDALPQIINTFLAFLKSFISGELDADKMDYILRDSYFSGCRYGMYNKDHLVNSLKVGFDFYKENKDQFPPVIFDAEFSLAILEKGIGALEDFIYARYQLYLELYNHKTVSGFRKLLSLAIDEVLSQTDTRLQVTAGLSYLSNFSNFTDTFFWEKFRAYSESHPNSACTMLIQRKKLRYIGKRVNENEKEIIVLCQRLSKSNSKKIEYWKSRVKFSKIDKNYKTIKVLIKKEDGTRRLKRIASVTDFFEKFGQKEIYHLFEIPQF